MKTATFTTVTAFAFATIAAARPTISSDIVITDPCRNSDLLNCRFHAPSENQNNNFGNGNDDDDNNNGNQINGVVNNGSGKSSSANQNNNFGNGNDDDNNNNGNQINGVVNNGSGKSSSANQNNNFGNGNDDGNNNNGNQINGVVNNRRQVGPVVPSSMDMGSSGNQNNNFGNGEDNDNNNSGNQINGVVNNDGGVVINGNINAPVTIVNVQSSDGTSYWSAYGNSWSNDSMLEHHMWQKVNIPDGHHCSFRYNGGVYSYGSGVHSFPKHVSFTQAMCS